MAEANQAPASRGNKPRHGHVAGADGGHGSLTYRTWQSIRNRCLTPSSTGFPRYGGRGITICDRWNVFENFLADMGERPTPSHSIDRLDNAKGYSRENCRWATRDQQARNRSSTKLTAETAAAIRALGGRMTQAEIARRFGVTQQNVGSILLGRTWKLEVAS
jgi:hypothetical protein